MLLESADDEGACYSESCSGVKSYSFVEPCYYFFVFSSSLFFVYFIFLFILFYFSFFCVYLCLGYMPPPAPLLDDSKYVSLPRQQQQHYGQSHSSRPSQHHHLHRPYSFTSGMLPDNPGQNLGSNFCWNYN